MTVIMINLYKSFKFHTLTNATKASLVGGSSLCIKYPEMKDIFCMGVIGLHKMLLHREKAGYTQMPRNVEMHQQFGPTSRSSGKVCSVD